MEVQEFIRKYKNIDDDNFLDKLNNYASESNDRESIYSSVLHELNEYKIYLTHKKTSSLSSEELGFIRDDIRNVKRKIEIVKNLSKKYSQEKIISENLITEKSNYENNFILPFSYTQIENIDKKFNINTNQIILELNDSENKNEKLIEIIEFYENILDKLKEESSVEIHTIEYLLKKLNLHQLKFKRSKEIDEFKNTNEEKKININLTPYQQEIQLLIKNNEDLDDYELVDTMVAFNHFIQTNDIIRYEEQINNCLCNLNYNLIDYMYEKETIFPEFLHLLDTLKNKINQTDKNSEERKMLKKILVTFKDVYNIYKDNNGKTKDKNTYFDIINYWLQDESNYLYIKEMLKRHKEVCNIKVNDKHIVVYLLDLYIENFKKMVKDKNSDYINLKYIEEVYYLFTKNYCLRISGKEKEEIDLKLKKLKEYIKENLKSQSRKSHAIEILKKMNSVNFYKPSSYCEFQNFDDDLLGYESNAITNFIKNDISDKKTKNVILFGKDAYNIEQNNDSIYLTLYAINYNRFITKNSIVDRYFEKCEMTKEKIDDFFKNRLSFKVGNSYPVYAYEIEFYSSGKVKNLKVKKDYVTITDKVINPSKSLKAQKIYNLFEKSVIKNGGTFSTFDFSKLNYHFEKILENLYVDFLRKEQLPFIYYGYSRPTAEEIEQNMNDLSNTLNDLDKSISDDIINIINTKNDNYHYSIYPISNGEYSLNLLNPLSYLGIENQRMLDNLYFNSRLYSTNERIQRLKQQFLYKYAEQVETLNKNINYIDPQIIKMNKGKMRIRIRL